MDLLSSQSYVESPFIIVKIGDYTFGAYSKEGISSTPFASRVTYPNFMQSLRVTKINGAVNTYTINMIYAISQGDDPNLLERVFSSVSSSRKITLSYGDWSSPSFVFREEEAIITKVTSNVDFSGSKITYQINCTSDALMLKASVYDFPAKKVKPSDEIKRILYDKSYGLLNIFYGMRDRDKVMNRNLIASDDKKVDIEAKNGVSILDYLNYLSSCMASVEDTSNSPIRSSRYFLNIVDDTKNEFGGPYFRIMRMSNSVNDLLPYNTYSVDIGYPGDNFVASFNIKNDEQWSILYNYSEKIKSPSYVYNIDDKGKLVTTYSPNLTTSPTLHRTTEANKTWWTEVTQFPISATLTIKGLIKPAILMSHVKINVYFYGQKHIASGTYIITRQVDTIDSSGYRTELTLTRVGGD